MRHILIILSLFLFSLTIISCSEKEEHTTTTVSTTTTDNTTTTSSGVFVAVGSSGIILKSSDGITWTEVSESASDNSSGLNGTINDITYGNGTYVLVGSLIGDVYSSSDGNSWTSRTSGTSNTLNGVTYKE